MLEKIEVNKEYLNSDSHEVKVWSVDSEYVFYLFTNNNTIVGFVGRDFALESWKEIPAPKKRYWLWDVGNPPDGSVFKSSAYLNEDGQTTNGIDLYEKEQLLKKHESEFIDIEEN